MPPKKIVFVFFLDRFLDQVLKVGTNCLGEKTFSTRRKIIASWNLPFLFRFFCAFPLVAIIKMPVTKQIIQEGDGNTFPQAGQQLEMHYDGTLEDGTVFDSSRRKGRPFKFVIGVGQVIQGWDEGVMTMSLGEKAKLTITGDMAYGPAGIDGIIPPNATLIFEVELLKLG